MKPLPCDIDELRVNIGDDAETERLLLTAFIDSCSEALSLLESRMPAARDAEYDQLWRTRMHQIKGSALNISAHGLSRLASQAQQNYQASIEDKRKQLKSVRAAFAAVENFIALHLQDRAG